MQTVYKYPVSLADDFGVSMPAGAKVLTVQTQNGEPFMWALVDRNAPLTTRFFRLAGTGHPIDDVASLSYVGTFQMRGGALVFHLFAYPEGR